VNIKRATSKFKPFSAVYFRLPATLNIAVNSYQCGNKSSADAQVADYSNRVMNHSFTKYTQRRNQLRN